MWHWQYLSQRRAGARSHKFATYSPGGATSFDFVVVFSGGAAIFAPGAKSAFNDCLVPLLIISNNFQNFSKGGLVATHTHTYT